MRKIVLVAIFSLVFFGCNTIFAYTLSQSDLGIVSSFESKMKEIIANKGENQRQIFVNLLDVLKNNSRSTDKVKAIFTELKNRLLGVNTNYGYGYIPVSTGYVNEVLKLVNQERAKLGLNQLVINDKLNQAAQSHAEYMKASGDFAHTTKAGQTPSDRVNKVGYTYSYVGENIAWNQKTSQEVMSSWMNSAGHKANILSNDYKEIGIGFKDYYWVQVFGTSR